MSSQGSGRSYHRQAEQMLNNTHSGMDRFLIKEDPATNPQRLVGRNDPCPCGSGQKFKKCCARKS